jgi:hypothetical protein
LCAVDPQLRQATRPLGASGGLHFECVDRNLVSEIMLSSPLNYIQLFSIMDSQDTQLEIPQGLTKDEIKQREKIIKVFTLNGLL